MGIKYNRAGCQAIPECHITKRGRESNFRAKRRIELRSWDEPKDHRNPRTSRRHPGHYRAPQENARGRIIGPTLPDQWQLAGTESWLDNRRVVSLHSFRGRPPALSR